MIKYFPFLFLSFLCSFSMDVYSAGTTSKDSIPLLIRDFKYGEALNVLGKQLQLEPSNKDLYAYKGFVCRELYAYDGAIDAYLKALALDSTDTKTLTALANTYKLSQDYSNAVRFYSKALTKDTTNRFLQLETATCKLLNNQFEEAVFDFLAIIKNDKTNIYVLKSLGYCYNQMELSGVSVSVYQEVLRIKPTDVQSVVSLANLYIKMKRYTDGLRVTEAYRSIDSTNWEVNSKNAYLYLCDKKFKPAIGRFLQCLNAGDTTKFNYKNLGISYYSINEYDTGKTYLEKALAMDSEDASTLHFLGICCYRSFYKELGIRYLEAALELYKPTEDKIALIYHNYAEACKGWDKCPSEKKLSSAIRAYEFNPTDSTLALNIGVEYASAKDWVNAIKFYEIYTKTLKDDEKIPAKYSAKKRYEAEIEHFKAKLIKQTEGVPTGK